ncbi:uncharacterized protein C8Q71DRAFT_728199 [Rhodofomes roseus]|uniref:Class II aldolase/adducin N-terminal domain-containing protein n=1 Tax=Rhodofomes roseus TaxID=34475 RepID=A0ABQ8JY63_9APHY|nr:uncharacterized protein C8Q71DRAFT_728199 [Rhodofomes roseus]KAH9829209.1 hypothetical protein C8Q71DRAFT_728199 [Rhodofomes roseus]
MNHGLLTVGKTVDEACYLFGLMERSCDIELKVMTGEARGEKVSEISPEEAAYNFKTSADPEVLYWDFQPDYDFEYEACNVRRRCHDQFGAAGYYDVVVRSGKRVTNYTR